MIRNADATLNGACRVRVTMTALDPNGQIGRIASCLPLSLHT